jgi:UDP-glucose 4-epimerase
VNDLAQTVAAAFGVPCDIRHLAARNEVVHAFSDHSKALGVFHPPAPVDLATGIDRMAKWVKQHGPATPVEFTNIELSKNLPASWAPK